MYCDRCGTPFAGGAQYCTSCGKQITGAPAAGLGRTGSGVPGSRAAGDGRVQRNLTLMAGLWAASGVLRLLGIGWLTMFQRSFGWGWPMNHWGPDLNPWMWGGLLSGGLFLALFGVLHLLLAWGLFERQPWARILGIVLGLLALIRIPFGTILGIYTLWVLLPERSGKEYEGLAGAKA
jgi:hypothetical protein